MRVTYKDIEKRIRELGGTVEYPYYRIKHYTMPMKVTIGQKTYVNYKWLGPHLYSSHSFFPKEFWREIGLERD